MTNTYGFQYRKLTKIEWNGKTFRAYYEYKNGERYINLTKYCCAYCEKYGTKFNKTIAEQLIATAPKELNIWIYPEPIYKQNHPYNTDGSCRLETRIDEEDLVERWLSKIIF